MELGLLSCLHLGKDWEWRRWDSGPAAEVSECRADGKEGPEAPGPEQKRARLCRG